MKKIRQIFMSCKFETFLKNGGWYIFMVIKEDIFSFIKQSPFSFLSFREICERKGFRSCKSRRCDEVANLYRAHTMFLLAYATLLQGGSGFCAKMINNITPVAEQCENLSCALSVLTTMYINIWPLVSLRLDFLMLTALSSFSFSSITFRQLNMSTRK